MAVVVRGLRDVNAAFAHTDQEIRLGWRAGMRQVAEPVRQDAELVASTSIRRTPGTTKDWSQMRVGVTRTMVYVAPRQRKTKTPGRSRRNLANLLMDRAMQPALERHEHQITQRFEQLLDRAADGFNHGV